VAARVIAHERVESRGAQPGCRPDAADLGEGRAADA
jgi:hypothetical protein